MTTPDLHSLAGAYVLHATADTERAAFERHLVDCASCAHEVREFQETTTRLAFAAALTPPPRLRRAVLDQVHEVKQHPVRRTHRGPQRWLAAAAAVLFAVVVSLGAVVTQQHDGAGDTQASALRGIVFAGDARTTRTENATLIVSHEQDRAVLLADLPAAPPGHTYQAWRVDTRTTSAGILAGNRSAMEITGLGGADRIAITVEPEGGSHQPSTSPVETLAVP